MTVFHSNGRASNNYTYNTLALGLDYRKWNFSTGYTSKQNQNEIKTKSLNLSTGYKFSNAIKIDIGYKHDTKYKKFSDRLGLLVSYSHEL
jgi:predicted porin